MYNFLAALEILGKGMAGIFTVLIILAICVWIMKKICG